MVLASVAILLAAVAGYVRRAAVDSDQFANRATAALRDDSVRSLVGERITDELVLANESDLVAARPLIQSIAESVVGSRAFTGTFRAGVRDVHRAVFRRDQQTVTLAVADAGTIVAAGLEVARPSIARRVRATERVELVRRDIGSVSSRAANAADTVRVLPPLLALVALLAAAGAIVLSTDRRRTVVHLGIGVAVAGAVLAVGLRVLRSIATGAEDAPEVSAALGAVWDAFLGDLRTGAWILAAAGIVVAAAAASLIRPVDIDAPLRRAAAWVTTEPARPALKAVRGVALIVAGLLFVFESSAVLQLIFTLVGLYLVYAGISAILWLVYQPRARPARAPSGRRPVIAAAVAGLVIVTAAGAFLAMGGTSTAAPKDGPCNGHMELCDRPLNEVALGATHNSMSVPLPGWYSSMQDHAIANQLQDGVRGLLIDTHYADRLENGRLRTVIGERSKLRQKDGVSPQAVEAALRLRDRVGFSGTGERDMYLCHSFCEIGGTRLSEVLADLHDFLVANPGEVVVVINQDYVTPEDFVGAVRDADLEELTYRGPTGGRWPTLRELIDTNQRVVFLAENEAGAAPWYHLAYESIAKETPYAFSRPPQLLDPSRDAITCRPNRGPERAPFFLVNHWITTDPAPLPSHADQVNAYEPMLRRMRACQSQRGHIPSLVAVNFYRRGALTRVVDALNGV